MSSTYRESPPTQPITIPLLYGGLGDHIAWTVAIRALVKEAPYVSLTVVTRDFSHELIKELLSGLPITFEKQSDVDIEQLNERVMIGYKNQGHSSLRTSLVAHAFRCVLDRSPNLGEDTTYKQIPQQVLDQHKVDIPGSDKGDYVAFAIPSTTRSRQLNPEVVNELVQYVRNEWNLGVVFLGASHQRLSKDKYDLNNIPREIDLDQGLNLIDQTTPLQAASVIASAQMIIGMDSGLMHLAACVDTPAVVGFSIVEPYLRRPAVACWFPVVPNKDCRYCQETLHYVADNDVRYCYYKDYKCLDSLTADKFIQRMEQVEWTKKDFPK